MSEKPKEEFEEDEPEELEDAAEDLDVDKLMRDFDTRKRRGSRVAGDPAWRKLERMIEDKRTRGLVSDFDDYEVDATGSHESPAAGRKSGRGSGLRR